uniref:Uncharacterized protein n=1 Tax=Spermophilus dauricus TaxID=99837 RepID=A0A8C9PUS3_SPEDA
LLSELMTGNAITLKLKELIEVQVGEQFWAKPGDLSRSGAAVCEFFLKAACGKGKRLRFSKMPLHYLVP